MAKISVDSEIFSQNRQNGEKIFKGILDFLSGKRVENIVEAIILTLKRHGGVTTEVEGKIVFRFLDVRSSQRSEKIEHNLHFRFLSNHGSEAMLQYLMEVMVSALQNHQEVLDRRNKATANVLKEIQEAVPNAIIIDRGNTH